MTSYRNKDWLRKKYVTEELSQLEIAELCGVSQSAIYKWMKRHGIEARDASECHKGAKNGSWADSPIKNREWLHEQYVERKLTLRQIADVADVSLRTVARWMERHNIPTRKGGNSFIADRSGSNNGNWKGGSTCEECGDDVGYYATICRSCHFERLRRDPTANANYKGLHDVSCVMRSHSKRCWRPRVLERDGCCVECGSTDNLHAHHITPFAEIRDQIIEENVPPLDLSAEEDRQRLVEIAKSDDRLNDISNGKTLCGECHRQVHLVDDLD